MRFILDLCLLRSSFNSDGPVQHDDHRNSQWHRTDVWRSPIKEVCVKRKSLISIFILFIILGILLTTKLGRNAISITCFFGWPIAILGLVITLVVKDNPKKKRLGLFLLGGWIISVVSYCGLLFLGLAWGFLSNVFRIIQGG